MSLKFLTFLTILILFLSALGSSAELLRRQANNCKTFSTTSFTTTNTAIPGCTITYVVPTFTAIGCGSCPGSSSSGPLKRQANNCITTTATSYTTTDTSIPGCTVTYVAPEATAVDVIVILPIILK
ncbi:13987_t:CDS:2 [Gigaspora margarita]|uniref:13987_t:CDS:1 n=1 Tax=Gigaspora margarita TaxID=4874 RepID=A0ABN7V0D9_GIGMA|nr:13987_t:CDS:2 [Gigaspora margarita]